MDDTLAYIASWVLGSVCVGLIAGYYLGKSRYTRSQEEEQLRRDREAVLKVLVELLNSAERMTSDVQSHNTEIQQTAYQVGRLDATGEMEAVKQVLLGHVGSLLSSNQRLQNDLAYSRYQMDEQAQQIDLARREARTDVLTTVGNRKAFDEKLAFLLAEGERHAQPFVLILVDLDHFKRINDAHGHQAGDRVLARVGECLNEWVPETGSVARYGGDEFAVLLPQTDMENGMKLAETIRSRIAERASGVAVRGGQVSISFSIGVTAWQAGDTVDSVLERADQGLYRSKRLGRNQVQRGGPVEQEALAGAGCSEG